MTPKTKHSPGRPSSGDEANNISMSITINRELLDRLDAARGGGSRSAAIREALERWLGGHNAIS